MTKKYDIASMMDKLMTRNTELFSKPAEPMVKKASLQRESLSAYERAINSLSKISEVCDDAGLTKTASIVLASLETLIAEAKKKPNKLIKDHLDKKKGKKDKKKDKKDDKKKGKKPDFLFKKKEEVEEVESEEDEDSKKKVTDDDSNDAADALDFDDFDEDRGFSNEMDYEFPEELGHGSSYIEEEAWENPEENKYRDLLSGLPSSDDWLSGDIDSASDDGLSGDIEAEAVWRENKLKEILGPGWKDKIKKLRELGWEGDLSDITSASDSVSDELGAKCKKCGTVWEYEKPNPDFVCRPCKGAEKIEAVKPDWSKGRKGSVIKFRPKGDDNSADDTSLLGRSSYAGTYASLEELESFISKWEKDISDNKDNVKEFLNSQLSRESNAADISRLNEYALQRLSSELHIVARDASLDKDQKKKILDTINDAENAVRYLIYLCGSVRAPVRTNPFTGESEDPLSHEAVDGFISSAKQFASSLSDLNDSGNDENDVKLQDLPEWEGLSKSYDRIHDPEPKEFELHSLLGPEPSHEEPIDEDLPDFFELKSASSKDKLHLVFAALRSNAKDLVDEINTPTMTPTNDAEADWEGGFEEDPSDNSEGRGKAPRLNPHTDENLLDPAPEGKEGKKTSLKQKLERVIKSVCGEQGCSRDDAIDYIMKKLPDSAAATKISNILCSMYENPTAIMHRDLDISEYDGELPPEGSFDYVKEHFKSTAAEKKKLDPKAKVRNRAGAIFSSKHPKVKDKKDHFPIDTIGRGRNALARSHQFSGAPSWWSGSLKELQSAVSKAVHGKYPAIKSEKKDKK